MQPLNDTDERVALLRRAYAAFNRRDVDQVLALLDPEVEWPNLLEGTIARGHDEVRAYWERQFLQIRSQVEPTGFLGDGDRVVVAVHQVVRNLDGHLQDDKHVAHAYSFQRGLVRSMRVFPTLEDTAR